MNKLAVIVICITDNHVTYIFTILRERNVSKHLCESIYHNAGFYDFLPADTIA